MLYQIVERDKRAFLKCRSCPYEEEIGKENPVVYEHNLQQDTSTQYALNPYMKYDRTLPRFNIQCPQENCPSRRKPASEIVGMKLDPVKVLWMYQCVDCDHTWKQTAGGV